ncbi:MAG TPA: Crp/Fnr family transcriptional regulator [Actinomycetota bacterium]|nr:Crp/Fnr family transcriptional regulator [Actinomycetota bacterium]
MEQVVRPGTAIVRQGDPCPPMRVVTRGAFMVEVLRHDGRRLVLDVLGPGDGVGGPADPVEGTVRISQATTRAIGPGRVRDALVWEQAPLLARRAERAARFAADLAWFDVPTRLIARLNVLAERFGAPAPGGLAIGIRLGHDDLAALCASSRESISRAMASLVAQGRIDVPRRGRIVVRRVALVQAPLPSCNRIRLHERQ